MRKLRRWIAINWLWLCVGIILTIIATRTEYGIRGRFEAGGEWLIPVMTVLAGKVIRKMVRLHREDRRCNTENYCRR